MLTVSEQCVAEQPPLRHPRERAPGGNRSRERVEQLWIVSTPALRLAEIGCEFTIGAAVVWRQHPPDAET